MMMTGVVGALDRNVTSRSQSSLYSSSFPKLLVRPVALLCMSERSMRSPSTSAYGCSAMTSMMASKSSSLASSPSASNVRLPPPAVKCSVKASFNDDAYSRSSSSSCPCQSSDQAPSWRYFSSPLPARRTFMSPLSGSALSCVLLVGLFLRSTADFLTASCAMARCRGLPMTSRISAAPGRAAGLTLVGEGPMSPMRAFILKIRLAASLMRSSVMSLVLVTRARVFSTKLVQCDPPPTAMRNMSTPALTAMGQSSASQTHPLICWWAFQSDSTTPSKPSFPLRTSLRR
mmetsp:Transcript_49216/g.123348  ORF Transcript_49216/g.123348 Transcript_49216/m.123348 type:complete len:288 (+) Transcript_49216:1389-2252(+)